jgi:hypothetical protein
MKVTADRITYEECLAKSRVQVGDKDESDPARTEELRECGPDTSVVLIRRDGELRGADFFHRRPDGLACFFAPNSPEGGACGDFHGFIRNGVWEGC